MAKKDTKTEEEINRILERNPVRDALLIRPEGKQKKWATTTNTAAALTKYIQEKQAKYNTMKMLLAKRGTTPDVRLSVLKSFQAVGGMAYLLDLARSEVASDRTAYVGLLAKCMPSEGNVRHSGTIQHAAAAVRPRLTREEWLALYGKDGRELDGEALRLEAPDAYEADPLEADPPAIEMPIETPDPIIETPDDPENG
jgi:hypothetical protein